MNRRVRAGGFTMIEVMIVIAIIGLILASSVMAVRNVGRSELRSAASRTAATLRYAFDRATMTGNTVRVAFDLDKGELWLEMSEQRGVALRKGDAQHHTTDEKEAATDEDDDDQPAGGLGLLGLGGGKGGGEGDDEEGGGLFGIDADDLRRKWERDLQPVARAKSLFKPIDKKRKLKLAKRVNIDAVVTPRMTDPVEKGKGYIYFFPQGHGEPAIVHFIDKSEDYYSVVLHPLTGKAKVYSCLYGIPDDFGVADDRRARRKDDDPCVEKR